MPPWHFLTAEHGNVRRNEPGSPNDPNSMVLSPVYIVGIAVAASLALGVFLWLGWKYRPRGLWNRPSVDTEEKGKGLDGLQNASPEKVKEVNGSRPSPISVPTSATDNSTNRTSTCTLSPLPDPFAAYNTLSPRSQYRYPTPGASPYASTTPSRRSLLRNSIVADDLHRHTMTEEEIINYHLEQGNMPVAFAPIAIEPAKGSETQHKASLSINGSVTATFLSLVEDEKRNKSHSNASSLSLPKLSPGPKTSTPQESRVSQIPISPIRAHFRLGSLTASIRNSLFASSGLSPPSSPSKFNFTFGKGKHHRQLSRLPPPTAENQRTVAITTFSPLLPDELVLKANETVTVIETFDDGWCIVARVNLGVIEVGAVPEYVFGLEDGENETFGTMRPMRSSSLGVKVDLRVLNTGEEPGADADATYRDSLVSWSNCT
ncbi:hypothetical protein FRB99_000166 [Tulasnella sp. 403]|nr:hypothetical protein FRB99_000166 [Tulasnella sp. 403]